MLLPKCGLSVFHIHYMQRLWQHRQQSGFHWLGKLRSETWLDTSVHLAACTCAHVLSWPSACSVVDLLLWWQLKGFSTFPSSPKKTNLPQDMKKGRCVYEQFWMTATWGSCILRNLQKKQLELSNVQDVSRSIHLLDMFSITVVLQHCNTVDHHTAGPWTSQICSTRSDLALKTLPQTGW